MVLFPVSRRNNFVGGTCTLPSALLVHCEVSSLMSCYEASYHPLCKLKQLLTVDVVNMAVFV